MAVSDTAMAYKYGLSDNRYLERKQNSPYINALGEKTDPATHYFQMIDNYMYLYHTGTLLIFPFYPDNIKDTTSVKFNNTEVLSRTSPIYSYENSGPRSIEFGFDIHRDMFKNIQYINTGLKKLALPKEQRLDETLTDDYADIFINEIQAAAYPVYKAASKMVNPPLVAVRFGKDIFIKGIIKNSVSLQYKLPDLANGKYAQVNFSFTIDEIDPYDANMAIALGSYRNGGSDIGDDMLSKLATHQYTPYTRSSGFDGRGHYL